VHKYITAATAAANALVHELLKWRTHFVGTLGSKWKQNLREETTKILKKDEIVALERNTTDTVTKWEDKRDVLTLHTRHYQ